MKLNNFYLAQLFRSHGSGRALGHASYQLDKDELLKRKLPTVLIPEYMK